MDIAANIKRIRKLKNLSQKEVALTINIAQGQYSTIESGKVVPTIPTLEKIAKVLEVDITEFFRDPTIEEEQINLSILEKVKLIDTLEQDEKEALLKMIDIALAKKNMKDNLSNLIAS
jgi:transcriptional regulator with XRE-family HTH domain